MFFILGMAHNDLFFVQIGPKKTILKRFYQLFQNTNGLQHKLLMFIESPNILLEINQKNKVCVVFGAKFEPNLVQCCENIIAS